MIFKGKIEDMTVENAAVIEKLNAKLNADSDNIKIIVAESLEKDLKIAEQAQDIEKWVSDYECLRSELDLTIQHKETLIKKLEKDLAAINQQSVENEEQLREELSLQFSREKQDLEAYWYKAT
jgi:hypothetical protein